MARTLTLAELASETGTEPVFLEQLQEIGVIGVDADGMHNSGDIFRVDTVRSLLDAGFTIEHVAEALDRGFFTFEFLDSFYADLPPLSSTTTSQLADSVGIDPEVLNSVYFAMGLPEPIAFREDEVEIIRRFVDVWDVDEDAMLRAARLVGEPVRSLTDGWTRLYIEKVSRPLEDRAVPVDQRIETIVATTRKATRLGPDLLLWLFQQHLRRSIDRANIEALESMMAIHGLLPEHSAKPAIAFVDVSGYTAMTQAAGDTTALEVSTQLRDLTKRAVDMQGGSLVKMLGDGAMLHFVSASEAVGPVVEIIERLREAGIPGHAGIHAGPVIEHDGDYYGQTVNLASRVAGVAMNGEIAITDAVRSTLIEPKWSIEPRGEVELRGAGEPVGLHVIRVDPVVRAADDV